VCTHSPPAARAIQSFLVVAAAKAASTPTCSVPGRDALAAGDSRKLTEVREPDDRSASTSFGRSAQSKDIRKVNVVDAVRWSPASNNASEGGA